MLSDNLSLYSFLDLVIAYNVRKRFQDGNVLVDRLLSRLLSDAEDEGLAVHFELEDVVEDQAREHVHLNEHVALQELQGGYLPH